MALATPTTLQIGANIVVQLEAALSQTIPLLPKAFSRVLAKTLAGVFVTLYKYAGSSLLQQFVSTASMAETEVNGVKLRPLVEWGRLIGIGDPLSATQAELEVTVTVLSQTGSLPGGSQLLHAPSGVVYQTVAAIPLDAAAVTVVVRATADQAGGDGSGTIGNLEVGQILSFASPLPNVETKATVTAASVIGADGELENVYRARILRRFQRRPQGGAYADYQSWGTEVPGVKNVYPYTGAPGEVDVYVEAVAGPDGIPDETQLAAVLQSINFDPEEAPSPTGLANRRPANAAVNVLPIWRTAFSVDMAGYEASDLTVIDAIQQAVDEYLRDREPFIVGLSTRGRTDRVTQGAVAGVVNEIAEANGASVGAVTLRRSGATVIQYTLGHGELAKLGTLTPV
jgi:uncharacterized phage protein gp47/JayE